MKKNKKAAMSGGAILAIIALLLIAGYFVVPEYKSWVDTNVIQKAKTTLQKEIFMCSAGLLEFDNRQDLQCPTIYDPVCGADGITYDNDCGICKAKTTSFTWTRGECK